MAYTQISRNLQKLEISKSNQKERRKEAIEAIRKIIQ